MLKNSIRACMSLAIVQCVLIVFGCASVPMDANKLSSSFYQDTGATSLGKRITPLLQGQKSKTGVTALENGVDAFVARYLFAESAERSIDAQYFIWRGDDTGKLLLYALFKAANRGVRVRLLLDDVNMAGNDASLFALYQHPNIEVRLFNPFANRHFRAIDFITDFSRVNRRMHNKSFTVDNQVTIVGGRNIGDEYFDANENTDFQDFDLMAIGAVVSDVSRQFDLYWNSPFAIPIEALTNDDSITSDSLFEMLEEHFASAADSTYVRRIEQSNLLAQLKDQKLHIFWGETIVYFDDPEKIRLDPENDATHLRSKIDPAIKNTQKELIIISPYFIPGQDLVTRLGESKQRGVTTRVLTNSLAATDVPLVYAGYSPYRIPLLENGVELYEMKSTYKHKRKRVIPLGSSKSSLHAKIYVFDRRQIFVGSYNLDPRSKRINTEMGLLVSNTDLAKRFAEWWDSSIHQVAYKLTLEHANKDLDGEPELFWLDLSKDPVERLDEEPKASAWHKIQNRFLSIFPLENQL